MKTKLFALFLTTFFLLSFVQIASSSDLPEANYKMNFHLSRGNQIFIRKSFTLENDETINGVWLKVHGNVNYPHGYGVIIKIYDKNTMKVVWEKDHKNFDNRLEPIGYRYFSLLNRQPVELSSGDYIIEFKFYNAGDLDIYYNSNSDGSSYKGPSDTNWQTLNGAWAISFDFAEKYQMVDKDYFLSKAPKIDFNMVQNSEWVLYDQWYKYNDVIRYTSKMPQDNSAWTIAIKKDHVVTRLHLTTTGKINDVSYYRNNRPIGNLIDEIPKDIANAALQKLNKYSLEKTTTTITSISESTTTSIVNVATTPTTTVNVETSVQEVNCEEQTYRGLHPYKCVPYSGSILSNGQNHPNYPGCKLSSHDVWGTNSVKYTCPSGQHCFYQLTNDFSSKTNACEYTQNTATSIREHTQNGAIRVFVTSEYYDGNLGGLSGADIKCQSLANAAGLDGKWVAWLSDSSISAKDRIPDTSIGYYNLDGTKIADNKADLINGSVDMSILITEKYSPIVWPPQAWSGSDKYGNKVPNVNCNNWTTDDYESYGSYGIIKYEWCFYRTKRCSLYSRLYCFEVPAN